MPMSWVNQIQHPRPLYMYLLYGADQLRDDILRLTAKLQIELNLKIKTIHLVFMPFLFYQILENFHHKYSTYSMYKHRVSE